MPTKKNDGEANENGEAGPHKVNSCFPAAINKHPLPVKTRIPDISVLLAACPHAGRAPRAEGYPAVQIHIHIHAGLHAAVV